MEKFIMAGGCAMRISDTGMPRKYTDKDAAQSTKHEHNTSQSEQPDHDAAQSAQSEQPDHDAPQSAQSEQPDHDAPQSAQSEQRDHDAPQSAQSEQRDHDAPQSAQSEQDMEHAAHYAPDYKTILLLHGYLGSIESWEDFIPILKPYVRVIAVDLPGHGISEVKGEIHTMEFLANTVYAALNELGINRCVVCGHSMGGYVALEMLRKYPTIMEGLILLHSTPFADSPEKQENRDREIAIVAAGKKELLTINASAVFAPHNRKRFSGHIEEAADRIYLTDDDGITALLRGMKQRRDNNDTLTASTVPQMFIFGRHDEYIPITIAEETVRLHPDARVAWLENSGHMGPVEEPRITADAILTFIRSIESGMC